MDGELGHDASHRCETTCAEYRRRGLSRRALARVLVYVEQHLMEPISSDDLARAACMSRFHFARLFRMSVGESPMRYVHLRRIERAKIMLLDARSTMADVAAELCFFDQSHFSRSFKKATGVAPRDFVHGASEFPCELDGADGRFECSRLDSTQCPADRPAPFASSFETVSRSRAI